jgi:GTP-binding protein
MSFTDELKIHAKAGGGGDGVVRWLHEKSKEFSGPAGGDGGRGGSVFALGVRDTHLLTKYKSKKVFEGERGEDGGSRSLHGKDGKDMEIELPIGSVITNLATLEKFSLNEVGERHLLLRGGMGGRGNEYFKKSIDPSPKKFTSGLPGEEADFLIELELIADIGLVGLPNAGKTSLLNELTRATGKVGAYPFTTLEPALGEMHSYILADIPGLIEGAAEGKGLGDKFLKHIRRTKLLAHLISLENEDLLAAYKTIRQEIERFDKNILSKREVVVLTKTDLVDEARLKEALRAMQEVCPDVLTVTVYDDNSVKKLKEALIGFI